MNIRERNPDSRKGDNGRLLVVGGSIRYFGAPALVSLAALRAGTDLVYTLVPKAIAPTVASYSPDLIVWGYEGEFLNRKALALVKELGVKAYALVIGNGLSNSPSVMKATQSVLDIWKKPAVIDADPIGRVKLKSNSVVYTPHDGEFLRLTGREAPKEIEKRKRVVQNEAARLEVTILLKGPVDVISNGEETYLNETGNAAMTCGGTGDVLAGLVGAFLSQGYSPVEAARIGAYVNGLAGDQAVKDLGYSMRASDLLGHIGKVMYPFSIKKRQEV